MEKMEKCRIFILSCIFLLQAEKNYGTLFDGS